MTDLDLEARAAHVVRGDPGWSTYAQSVSRFDILGRERSERRARVEVSFGTVRVTTRGDGVPAAAALGRGAGNPPPRPARTCPDDQGGVVDGAAGRARRGRGAGADASREPCTPPSTPPSGCCRSSRPPTAGTSVACPPRCTPTRPSPPSWSSTAIPAAPASPSARTPRSRPGCARPATPCSGAPAPPAALPASSRRSAGTGTSRWTRPGAVTVLELALATSPAVNAMDVRRTSPVHGGSWAPRAR